MSSGDFAAAREYGARHAGHEQDEPEEQLAEAGVTDARTRAPGPNAGVKDPLQDALFVCEPATILAGLAREWVRKGDFCAQTVIELQEALHARELARATQPLSVTITPPTRPAGMPAYNKNYFTIRDAVQLQEEIRDEGNAPPARRGRRQGGR